MNFAIGIDINGNEHRFEIDSSNYIWCHRKNIKSLNVYDEDNKIKELYCHYNQLENLIIHGGKNIEYIFCFGNKLTKLNLSMCEKLKHLSCDIVLENNIILPNNNKLIKIYYE